MPPAGTLADLPAHPELRLDGVTVAFPGRTGAALTDFSLCLRPGEIVALTGPSGCGKSTVVKIILGFVTPRSGNVRMDNIALTQADPTAWRARIAWVPQHPYLFAGTVADNIRLGQPSLSDSRVRRAADQARVDIPLTGLVGEDGAGLSAGQRQRVALARAFLRDSPIVLLDEPTAGLDPATEADLIESIRDLTRARTVLLVAHRPALMVMADRVVSMSLVEELPAPDCAPVMVGQ